ncbi:DinB family protein [Ferruginibacter lapsinanis]|uniref:DinB family protein n=1 Tax=Ferruginibacter lapsinanis TaxID=563172 RepID=UPI001E382DEE|nr:DinB family protein [Ferruginibacter lapsinanis]UEG48488.1 DinB family protein [Ferruginibacter lapsinanis]
MKELLSKYASYNAWANKKIFDRAGLLTEEQVRQEIASSFPSIYKTALHLLDAESIWWQRIKLTELVVVPSQHFTGSFSDLVVELNEQSGKWESWVKAASDNQIQHVFAYQNSKKEQFKQPVNEVLLHIFNHGTYHRGQIVTMFRQLGIDNIPQTDFAFYMRNLK